jgi:hypothetical protein
METQKRSKAAKSKFREAGGDSLTFIVPRDFNLIAKSEAKSNNRGAGGKSKNMRSRQSNVRNRSTVFKQFLKCLSKPGKIDREKMPTTKQLLAQREYVEYERKKEVMCEIIPIDIKSANNDSMKCLVFKIGKADPTAKKNNENTVMNTTDMNAEAMLGIDNLEYYRTGGEQTKTGLEYLKKSS